MIAFDGKTLRRSHDKAQEQEAIEIVSAWAVSQRLTLGHVKAADDSNEILKRRFCDDVWQEQLDRSDAKWRKKFDEYRVAA